eukprot:Sspe_Gene.32757::Locus_16046_Transcript_1_1_Confidence_1.000_Length_1449::g.32757::m.32757/K03934/NDUFS1; NADH dehydrogenase (ubiquinone) Fe-S protein 1
MMMRRFPLAVTSRPSRMAVAVQARAKKLGTYQGNELLHEKMPWVRELKPKGKSSAVMFINYKPVKIEPGEENLIEVCLREGIVIPKFCYHQNLSVAGNCRMCMVQLAGTQNIIVSCATPVMAGMSVLTETRLVKAAREGNIELLVMNHPLDCPICDQQWECDLQDITHDYGSRTNRFREDKHCAMDKTIDVGIKSSFNKCIHCTRCTRWVQEETKDWSWGMMGRGSVSEISTFIPHKFSKTNYLENRNFFAAHLCPVGALNPNGEDFSAEVGLKGGKKETSSA